MNGDQRRNKRKMIENHAEQENRKEEEQDEEEKMEKFYALIRSTREMHDFIRRQDKNKAEAASVPWNPCFQPEDFLHNSSFVLKDKTETAAASLTGPSKRQERKQEQQEEEEKTNKRDGEEEQGRNNVLDLNLSL